MPTARNLFLVVIAILTLDTFRSVRFAHKHVISKLTNTSLNAFYYTLKTDHYDHTLWNDVTTSKALHLIPDALQKQPLFLSIDDAMVEKSGKKFELCSKLYDHAAHNGSNYLNGHCMVSLLLSFPVFREGRVPYLSVPLGYRLWDKKSQSFPWLPISTLANYQIPGTNTWVSIINWLNDFIQPIESDYDIVFLDANPSFSMYTQIAIATSTKVILPVMADDSSRRAIQNAFSLIYGLKLPSEIYSKYAFAEKLKEVGVYLHKT